jgi:hypothetical protein
VQLEGFLYCATNLYVRSKNSGKESEARRIQPFRHLRDLLTFHVVSNISAYWPMSLSKQVSVVVTVHALIREVPGSVLDLETDCQG